MKNYLISVLLQVNVNVDNQIESILSAYGTKIFILSLVLSVAGGLAINLGKIAKPKTDHDREDALWNVVWIVVGVVVVIMILTGIISYIVSNAKISIR